VRARGAVNKIGSLRPQRHDDARGAEALAQRAGHRRPITRGRVSPRRRGGLSSIDIGTVHRSGAQRFEQLHRFDFVHQQVVDLIQRQVHNRRIEGRGIERDLHAAVRRLVDNLVHQINLVLQHHHVAGPIKRQRAANQLGRHTAVGATV